MRDSFVATIYDLAKSDPNLILAVGDLGFHIFDQFRRDLPDQFLNVGIAEQNLIGLSTGMALEGKTVIAYSIGSFPTLRALEQIRNDVCYHHVPVTIVAAGVGFCYGALGASHHATEDIACLRGLPNLTILSPGDPLEAQWATRAAYRLGGPCYLRLGRAGEPAVNSSEVALTVGAINPLREQGEVALFATGSMLHPAMEAAELLAEDGLAARLYSVPTIKPLDADLVRAVAQEVGLVVSLEEHNVMGGLGSCLAEVLAEMPSRKAVLARLGVTDTFVCRVGAQDHLRDQFGLSPRAIRDFIGDRLDQHR